MSFTEDYCSMIVRDFTMIRMVKLLWKVLTDINKYTHFVSFVSLSNWRKVFLVGIRCLCLSSPF